MNSDLASKPAFVSLKYFNKNMFIGQEKPDLIIGIEDHSDPDGRLWRLEYQATLDGKHANAYCRSNPWNRNNPQAGTNYLTSHVSSDGMICLGTGAVSDVKSSPFDLETAIKRARFWCVAFSVYKESGDASVFKV